MQNSLHKFTGMRSVIVILSLLAALTALAQKKRMNSTFLEKLLKSHPELFTDVLNHPTNNEVQILYTRIDRDKNNVPHFTSFGYHLDKERYFYPASTVKLPASIFALEKLNDWKIDGLTRKSSMLTDSNYKEQTTVRVDKSAENGLPSIDQYIRKILLVSDNDAYNRLYEFIGRNEINDKLRFHGAQDSRIINRLAIGDGGESARHTNPIRFVNGDKLIYQQPGEYDKNDYPLPLYNLIRGKGYLDANDSLIMKPYSFENKNVFTLQDQQHILKKLLFPEAFAEKERYHLTADDYHFLYKYMSMYPTESKFPRYNEKEFWTLHSKFLYYGASKNETPDPKIRIFNKYGDSYGYVLDNSYFVDFENKVEFMLMAVVQSNKDEIYNDNKYEYETICYPFLKNLGKVIYELELNRKKKYIPDLSKFKINYVD